MCGRFTLATPAQVLAALFEIESADWNDPRFNIAPQVRIVTVRRLNGARVAQSLLWGAVNPRDARPLINARSETAATSPLFSRAFAADRLLVPADGFYEWTKEGSRRQARYFQQPGGAPFAFAGLGVNPGPLSADTEPRAVILTTQASDSVRAYHDRMPMIVPRTAYAEWLSAETESKTLLERIAEAAQTAWISHAVGPGVNNVRNDTPQNILPHDPAPDRQSRLF